MTAQQYLYQYRSALIDLQRSERLIKRITALLEVQGVDTSAEKVQTSKLDDRTARLVAELVDAKREFRDLHEESVRRMRTVAGVIRAIEDPQQKRLLELRYIEGLPWHEIAEKMYVSYRHVFRIHSRALEEAGEKITFSAER